MSQGLLRIVDAAGTAVEVTTPGQVNLTSTALRIAAPSPTPVSGGDDARAGRGQGEVHTGDSGTTTATGTTGGGASATSSGTGTGTGSGSGAAASGGGQAAPPVSADRQVAFSFTSNLLAGAETADGFAALFRAFYMALDERQISYLQGTLQLVADSSVIDQIQPLLADLGITATIKEL